MKNAIAATIIALTILTGCVNHPRNYEPAGFESWQEAKAYAKDYIYYANKLTDEEWDSFYKRFPEYYKDIQLAKQWGSSIEYHPTYTSYALRWSTNNRKVNWSPAIVERLDNQIVSKGDNIFRITYALGSPKRVIWDNDFEMLLYSPDNVFILEDGGLGDSVKCKKCFERDYSSAAIGQQEGRKSDNDIVKLLGLKRPTY